LQNDGDPDGDALTVTLTAPPSNGSVSLAPNGSFTYTPTAGFFGTDTFDYSASDGFASATATVSISVSNAAPTSTDDAYTVFRNQTLSVPAGGVLDNDTDADGDALSATLWVGTANGTVTLAANGGFTYTPIAGYVGGDAFTYHASDGTASSGRATVIIQVKDRKPVAGSDKASVDAGAAISRPAPGLLANDTDADGDALSSTIASGPSHGTASVAPNGAWTYVPDPGFSNVDTFTYTVSDGVFSSTPATVQITVRAPDASNSAAPTPEPTESPAPSPTAPVSTASAIPTATPTPTLAPTPTASPTPSALASAVPGVIVPRAGSGGSAGRAFAIPDPTSAGDGTDDLGLAAAALGGLGSILWAVPSLILSVPGLLLVLAISAQALGGLAWLPVARRKLGSFGLRRRQAGAAVRS
jgi:VCBS repeat-containing protein